ncbi:glutathione synthase [Photobacterium nomapromontoriensis]|uniref:glutathione synthase n=1 Tax=Photobacterium nomapromontoriensis TaxID=2910237 RepID=UPI003D127058
MNLSPILPSQTIINELSEWAMMHGVAIKNSDGTARHCPFSLAPIAIKREVYNRLITITPLIARLVSNIAEDHTFISDALSKMAKAEPFFNRLFDLHQQIHFGVDTTAKREPLLIMRTDYMDDRILGPKVIEFNGIAAGMGPFGQRAHEFHRYVQQQWPAEYGMWAENPNAELADNQGLEELAQGIATTARHMRQAAGEDGKPLFVMVVQENEDNIYDQHLLEVALQQRGIKTVRRTFVQLASQLSTGKNDRLALEGLGNVDVIYLRAGYQYQDYCHESIIESECCYTLSQTRAFIERHHVAVNATVSQQLATSKTMQMLITNMPATELVKWGLTLDEAEQVKLVLAPMLPITVDTQDWLKNDTDNEEWVLKNQGEGGGHCVFGRDIATTLASLTPDEYDAWALMQRLHPHTREKFALGVRETKAEQIDDLISEIGLFTIHFRGQPVTSQLGYAGYLVRSKPATENEGGIHSGRGILDSLALIA